MFVSLWHRYFTQYDVSTLERVNPSKTTKANLEEEEEINYMLIFNGLL